MPSPRREAQFRVLGLQRSGNHAVIDWLVRNMDGEPVVHLNRCRPGDPRTRFDSIQVGGTEKTPSDKAVPAEVVRLVDEAVAKGALIVSYENIGIGRTLGRGEDFTPVPGVQRWHTLVITRSFANWLASFHTKRHGQLRDERRRARRSPLDTVEYVRMYAEVLDHLAKEGSGVIHVRYDDWLVDEAYRDRILDRLGLPRRDNSLNTERFIRRSSFGDARTIDVDDLRNRWKSVAGEPLFQALMVLSAHDQPTVDAVARHYPDDAALLTQLREGTPVPQLAAGAAPPAPGAASR